MRTVIRNAYIVDPKYKFEGFGDIAIKDEYIEFVGEVTGVSINKEIDATGLIASPGFVDLHAHFRDPGFLHKETMETGMKAAVKGGFTTVCIMPNTNPVIDNIYIVEYIKSKVAQYNLCDIYPIGTISQNQNGRVLSNMISLKKAGCVAFSDDGKPVMDAMFLRKAFIYSSDLNIPITLHEEDINLSANGVVNECDLSFKLGLEGIPNVSESSMIARDIEILKSTKAHAHICHVSTKESLDIIKIAKVENTNITFEITPHHLSLTDREINNFNTYAKVNPPLRSHSDVLSLHLALRSKLVDAIATDHAPHDEDSKQTTMQNAAFGISGLETAFSVVNTYIVKNGILSLMDAIELMTVHPAEIYHLKAGSLSEGEYANIVLINTEKEWVVNRYDFISKGKNTPFHGKKLLGSIQKTFYKGKIVFGS